MMMVLSEKLTRRPCPSSSGRLFLLVLVVGLAVAMALSMALAGDVEAKKKPKKKKKAPPPTSIQAPSPQAPSPQALGFQAPGTTFQKPPTNAYLGESVARAWGYNGNGQLGDGTTTNRNTPVGVSNLSGVKAIAGGDLYNLALKEDGTVWAWGENDNSELGDGTTTTVRNTPVQVSNLGNVNAIAASGHHSLVKVLIPPVNTQ